MIANKLEVITDEVRRLDLELDPSDSGFQLAVILMAAAFVTGPDIERIASFTGHPRQMVADVSRRMHEAGLWEKGVVKSDYWFQGDKWTAGLWCDTLVAEGRMKSRCNENGQREYGVRQHDQNQ